MDAARHRRQRARTASTRRLRAWPPARRSRSRPSSRDAVREPGSDTGDRASSARSGPPPAAARADYAVVHYKRPDGDYDGWGLHTSGVTSTTTGRRGPTRVPFAGEDAYGRFAWVKLAAGRRRSVGLHRRTTATRRTRDVRPVLQPAADPGDLARAGRRDRLHVRGGRAGLRRHPLRRPDGDYAGWGLHLWGDAIAAGEGTDWARPEAARRDRRLRRVLERAAAWPTRATPRQLHHPQGRRRRTRAPTSRFIPAGQRRGLGRSPGDATIHPTRGRRRGLAVIHYHRADGDYGDRLANFADFWGLHVWAGAATPTEWTSPMQPAGTDALRAGLPGRRSWPTRPSSPTSSTSGDTKDLPADQSLDLVTVGHEVWYLSGHATREQMPVPAADRAGAGIDADLTKAKAHWLDRGHGRLERRAGPATRRLRAALRARPAARRWSTAERHRRPRRSALTAAGRASPTRSRRSARTCRRTRRSGSRAGDLRRGPRALRGQLVVVERAPPTANLRIGHRRCRSRASLDDLYAGRPSASLGATGPAACRRPCVWAPTAQSVALRAVRHADRRRLDAPRDDAATTRPASGA